jgi:hypothetical protein
MSDPRTTKDQVYYCSLCAVSHLEIPLGAMIHAHDVNVCNGCVSVLQEIVWSWRHAEWLKFKDLAP